MNKKQFFLLLLFILTVMLVSPAAGNAGNNEMRPFWHPDAGTPAQRFELAKRTTPELIAFLRRMPKGGDLHLHVSGGVYCEYMLDRAEKTGLFYNVKTAMFQKEKNGEHVISITQLKQDPNYLTGFLDRFSMRGWHPGAANGHDHFFYSFYHIGSFKQYYKQNDAAFIAEIVNRNRGENVQYLELMLECMPGEQRRKFRAALKGFNGFDDPALHALKGKELEKKLEAVLTQAFEKVKPLINDKTIGEAIKKNLDKRDAGVREILGLTYDITGNDGGLVVRYMERAIRVRGLKGVFVDVVAGITAINSDRRVVAMNLAAPEEFAVSRVDFEKHMMIFDFLWRKLGKPNFSIHSGELVLKESPVEPMKNRIRLSIEKGHAKRIGHGISVGWEKDLAGLLAKMREEKILVEICLSSNEQILGVKNNDHPFNLYRRAGVPLSINTDDAGVSRSNLTMEMVKAVQRYNLSYDGIKTLVRNSLEYSFLPGKSLFIDHDYAKNLPGFENIHAPTWKPGKAAESLMKKHPKLKRQVILERAFVEFETSLQNGFREK